MLNFTLFSLLSCFSYFQTAGNMTVFGNSVSCFCSSSDAVIAMTDVFPWLCVVHLSPSFLHIYFLHFDTRTLCTHTNALSFLSILMLLWNLEMFLLKIWNHFSPHCLIHSCLSHCQSAAEDNSVLPLLILFPRLHFLPLCVTFPHFDHTCSQVVWCGNLLRGVQLSTLLLSPHWPLDGARPQGWAASSSLLLSVTISSCLFCKHLQWLNLLLSVLHDSFFPCILLVCILTEGPGKKVQLSKDIQKKKKTTFWWTYFTFPL